MSIGRVSEAGLASRPKTWNTHVVYDPLLGVFVCILEKLGVRAKPRRAGLRGVDAAFLETSLTFFAVLKKSTRSE